MPEMAQLRTLADLPAVLALLPDDCSVTVVRSPLSVVVQRGVRRVELGPGDWLVRSGGRVVRAAAVLAGPDSCPSRRGEAALTTADDQPPTTVHLPATA